MKTGSKNSVQNEFAEADDRASQAEHGLVDIGSSFGAHAQSPEAFDLWEDEFHRSSNGAQAGSVFDAAVGDDRCDAACAVLVVVVGAVGIDSARPTAWLADHAADRRDSVDPRDQLGDAVAVATGQRDGQCNAARIGDRVAWSPACAGRPDSGPCAPPLSARRWVESTRAADRSSSSLRAIPRAAVRAAVARPRPRATRSTAAGTSLSRHQTARWAAGSSRMPVRTA